MVGRKDVDAVDASSKMPTLKADDSSCRVPLGLGIFAPCLLNGDAWADAHA